MARAYNGGMQRYVVHFSGRVQGVGFRYTAARIAAGHPVAGFVENLDDGRVRLVAEGETEALDAFVESILARMEGYVKNHTLGREAATGEFGGAFVVRQ